MFGKQEGGEKRAASLYEPCSVPCFVVLWSVPRPTFGEGQRPRTKGRGDCLPQARVGKGPLLEKGLAVNSFAPGACGEGENAVKTQL